MAVFGDMWISNANYTLWESIWIASILVLMNVVLCSVTWFIQKETIIECGYRKASRKKIKKEMREWRIFEKLLLQRLLSSAKEPNPILGICFLLNILNILALLLTFVGYVGAILTKGDGWAMVLVLFPGFIVFCINGIIHLVCDLIWVPSERQRYGISKKKRNINK